MAVQQLDEADRVRRIETYHQQVILIVGFIGGIVFAGLVLVLGNPSFILNGSIAGFANWTNEQFFHFVVEVLTFTSGLSAIVVVESLFALTFTFKSVKGRAYFWRWIDRMTAAVFALFESSLLLLLWPIVQYWAWIAMAPILAIFFVMGLLFRRSREME